MEQLIKKAPRIEVVDALRGFAVMGIILVHNLEHFVLWFYPTDSPVWLNILDQGVFKITFGLFSGKAYAIFALLFGFTFYLQWYNQKRKGKDFGYRFLWRLLFLLVFATLNAAFFPGGDVLLSFACIGVLLFIVRNWRDKAILIAAIFFLLQPLEWYHYLISLFDSSYQLPDLHVNELYNEMVNYTKTASFGEFIWGNITIGQKACFLWSISVGRLLQMIGLFFLGFYIGRKQLFVASEKNLRLWIIVLIIAAVAFGPLYQLKEAIMQSDVTLIKQTTGVIFDRWQKLAFTFILVASFVLLYQRKGFKKGVNNLRFYGRMSLTNYITQSIMGTFVYFPFGLYLAPHCGYTLSLFIGLCLFFLQLYFCIWWLKRHKKGPLESIWHKWTWLRS